MSPTQMVVLGLIIPGLSYVLTAYGYVGMQRPWMAVAFVGYVIGNVGFVMDAIQGK